MDNNQQESRKELDRSLQTQESRKELDRSLQTQESRKELDQSLLKDKYINRNIVLGSLIATLIALTPYLFSLYESVPNTQIWSTFLFTYDSSFWLDANYVMWVLTGKLIPLYLLFIWFFTCRHWWYHALLVPIIMYVFQIMVVLNGDTKYMDEFQLIYLVPTMALVVPTIYLIRAKMFNQINTATKSMQELEDEFKLSPKNFWDKIKQYF
ncbi:hypothetical protein [Mariniflexile sp.]|uniref:hypothetical protein n=1 Tax=Mariniflexile sp. TaxID=1979402 RepID=UPI0040476C2A